MITVTRVGNGDPLVFEVVIAGSPGATRHRVTLSAIDLARLAHGATPERVLEAALRFLLDREPKESILSSFDVSLIARYFPEFERELPAYLVPR
jgi:hypothetical protein